MISSPKLASAISTLLPKIKLYWRLGNSLLLRFISAILSHARITIDTLGMIFKSLVKQADQLIEHLAHHPLLDKAESMYRETATKLEWLLASIKHSKSYYKATVYAQLIRLDKPIGILLLLWPTLIALWIAAEGWPNTLVLTVFIIGVILMRSAGCAINDYADRDIDRKVKRTKQRPLTSGKISEK